ncbi:MAG: D-aminoacyl-tRNA deacylase [Bryobacterales bacterium]
MIQRVRRASVTVDGKTTGAIEKGLLILLGVGVGDSETDARYLAEKTAGLRIFEDDSGKMNLSVEDIGGGALVVSQFTLYGDVRRGRRPSFDGAAKPDEADRLYRYFCEQLEQRGLEVQTGVFQAMMNVELLNEGPVTILLDSSKLF